MSSTGTRSRRTGNEQHDDEHTGARRGAADGRPEAAGDQIDQTEQDEPDDAGAAGKGRRVKSSTTKKTKSAETKPAET
ncbi:MAG TPA: hypothetical protein VH008_21510, partial [Pseudonocardia sp.]|nr:hypothetical protein [Pseudonocardia sp.]